MNNTKNTASAATYVVIYDFDGQYRAALLGSYRAENRAASKPMSLVDAEGLAKEYNEVSR